MAILAINNSRERQVRRMEQLADQTREATDRGYFPTPLPYGRRAALFTPPVRPDIRTRRKFGNLMVNAVRRWFPLTRALSQIGTLPLALPPPPEAAALKRSFRINRRASNNAPEGRPLNTRLLDGGNHLLMFARACIPPPSRLIPMAAFATILRSCVARHFASVFQWAESFASWATLRILYQTPIAPPLRPSLYLGWAISRKTNRPPPLPALLVVREGRSPRGLQISSDPRI